MVKFSRNIFKKRKKIEKKKEKGEPSSIFSDELSLSGLREKKVSPLNFPVWRLCMLVAAGCFASWLIHILVGFYNPIAIWFGIILVGPSWIFAVRMLLLDSKLKKFWIVWLSASIIFIFIFISNDAIWVASASFSFIFLLFRRYRPYFHMTARRRAVLFLLGLFVFSLLTFGWIAGKQGAPVIAQADESSAAEPGALTVLGNNLARYFLASLRIFWFFSLFRIFFSIRLHFMKLKPKLAVTAFLIVVIPILLLIVIGLLILYSSLGESRAARARAILEDWAKMAVIDESFIHTLSIHSFSYETFQKKILIKGEEPSWLAGFIKVLSEKASDRDKWFADLIKPDEANFLWIGSELWLLSPCHVEKPNVSIRGCRVGNEMMDRLAAIFKCDVRLIYTPSLMSDDDSIERREGGSPPVLKELQGKYFLEDKKKDPGKTSTSLWQRPLYFGVTHLDSVYFEPGVYGKHPLLLTLQTNLSTITQEFFSEKNVLSLAIMIALISLAVLMFILESFGFIFGIRITTGITSAVKALHRGTRCIAEDDLETQIDIPNEDELGDLAHSFNVMTAAVKKGREEAVARERLERELETARQIQERLLPHEMPQLPGFEIAGTSVPSQQVGGDYFDFLDMGTGHLGVAIADVSGKGIPAALLMANLQASLHAQIIKKGTVSDVAFRMNNLLVRSTDTHMFATFFYGVLDRGKSTFTSTNAGHNPPLLFHADGNIERLEAGGLVLGFLPDQHYDQDTVTIKPGEVIVLYTDGITEAVGPSSKKISENLFGEERLIDVVGGSLAQSASEIQSQILEAITRHTANIPQYDDITLVVIKRKEH